MRSSPRRVPGPLVLPAVVYVGAVLVAALVLLGLTGSGLLPRIAIGLIALPLGPIGVLLWLIVFIESVVVTTADAGRSGSAGTGGLWGAADDGLVLAVAAAVAIANVGIAHAVLRRSTMVTPPRYRGPLPVATDRFAGIAGFLTAAAAFVGLCVLAGYTAAVAPGIDVTVAPGRTAVLGEAAALAWTAGLVAAVGGLAMWITAGVRGTAMLRWAALDLAVQALAIGVLVTVATS